MKSGKIIHVVRWIFSVIVLFSMLPSNLKAQATVSGTVRPAMTIDDTATVSVDSLIKKIAALENEILNLKSELGKQINLNEVIKKHDEQREMEMVGLRKQAEENKRQIRQYQARVDQNQSELRIERERSRQELDLAMKRDTESQKAKLELEKKITELQNQIYELKGNSQE